MARCWQVVTQREMFPGGTARATNPPRLRRLDGINHHGKTNGIPMRRCCRIGILCLKRRPHPVGHASALKGLKPSAQAGALGKKGISNSRPERAKALLLKAFALSGRRMMCARINPGRQPGLGARWLRLRPSRLGHSSKLDGSRCSVRCPFGARKLYSLPPSRLGHSNKLDSSYGDRIKRYARRIKRYENRIKRYGNRIKRYDCDVKRYDCDVKRLPLLRCPSLLYKVFLKKTPTPT